MCVKGDCLWTHPVEVHIIISISAKEGREVPNVFLYVGVRAGNSVEDPSHKAEVVKCPSSQYHRNLERLVLFLQDRWYLKEGLRVHAVHRDNMTLFRGNVRKGDRKIRKSINADSMDFGIAS